MRPRLEEYYKQTLKKELMNELQCNNIMEVPGVQKIIVNMGLGEAINDKNILNKASDELAQITGQKPVTTKARKSVAGFKIRKNWPIGCKVTLRRKNMYNFLDNLISVAIPRIKDFRGFSDKSFDGRGNYTLGIDEQIVFPEIEYDKVDSIRGMDITIVTTATNDEQGKLLLQKFNFPFKS